MSASGSPDGREEAKPRPRSAFFAHDPHARTATDGDDERRPFVVVKVGGSLLELPDLAERLEVARAARPGHLWLVVPGGGKTADAVRAYQATHGFSDSLAHQLAIQAMDLNGRLLAELFRRFLPGELVAPFAGAGVTARRIRPPGVCLPNMETFLLSKSASRLGALPESWAITSDSIAACAAEVVRAEELILLKSRPAPEPATRERAVHDGGVDPRFAEIARNVPRVTWIDLRSDPTREVVLE